MVDILQSIASSQALALLGALVIVSLLVAPVVLRLAGLSGEQIMDTLITTARMFISLVKAFRAQNGDK